ncbi:Gti1/Pac2 family-domain-containing protein [Zychaea mexicana]|uniref:Gti1/Pac2 family-domain-containing protein n=1 Tax=Zychaea mexicana TaxID=64656 RepID=UPI0022FEC0B9|nr:Gti1/Pac2 family-domain-containing protein [Zychaea mexicana]KAI9498027.1 Gti1/Pac2 family-domain-containing protein [Zychaea mexicana]
METYVGHIKTPQDALIVFEACRRGQLSRVQRRLSSKERSKIESGSVFAWDEREAGMRRWTDGRTWSPSRVLGSFLTYRELDTKRRPRRNKTTPIYSYKQDGLIKQSFSICTASNQKLHLISYYTKADVIAGRLALPSADPFLSSISVPKGLYPELNPLETSGGHSATIHSMLSKKISPSPPSLSSSPISSDEDIAVECPPSPVIYYTPRAPLVQHSHHSEQEQLQQQERPPASCRPLQCNTTALPSPPLLPLLHINSPTSSSEDARQLKALECQLRL